MLVLLAAHIIISFSCLASGFLFYSFSGTQNAVRPLIFNLISGLIVLTILVQVASLFSPIGPYVQVSLGVILLSAVLLKRKTFVGFLRKIKSEFASWGPLSLIFFLFSCLVILLINAGPVIMDDTESYHIQSIKWIQEYGSVPGLVNLHERFGFNSSWFSSVALFSFSTKSAGNFTVLNGVLSIWLCYWCISKYNEFQKENNLPAAFSMLITFFVCLAIWPMLRGSAATTNYDFIATCLVLILFTEIFFSKDPAVSTEWIIWPAYLFTVRIINFPLLLLSLIALIVYIKQKNFRTIILSIAGCLLLAAPFIIRNIIISGYPFYPATNLDPGVDWKPDPQMTERLLEYIKYYNRVSTTYLDIEQTKALGKHWLLPWFKYLFIYDKFLVLAGVAGIALAIAKRVVQTNKIIILLRAISIIWIVCWLLVSPDPRFIYGILLFGIFLLSYQVVSMIKNFQFARRPVTILLVAAVGATAFYLFYKTANQKEYRNWITPAALPQPPVKEFVIDGIIFRIPETINNNWNARCYGTELPCLYKIDPRLKARGKDIRSGFRLEK